MKVVAILLIAFAAVAFSQVPWKNCGQAGDHFTVNKLSVSPFPPVIGQNLSIIAQGSSDEVVTAGTVNIDLSFDGITLINQTFDLCRLIHGLKVSCPIPSGPLDFNIVQLLPGDVPPGEYTAIVHGYDQNQEELLCVSVDLNLSSTQKVIVSSSRNDKIKRAIRHRAPVH